MRCCARRVCNGSFYAYVLFKSVDEQPAIIILVILHHLSRLYDRFGIHPVFQDSKFVAVSENFHRVKVVGRTTANAGQIENF